MIFAGIVAGGIGARFGGDIPKQFLILEKKPIIVHTIEKFLLCEKFDSICVGIHKNWKSYTEDIFKKFNLNDERLLVTSGGENRNETIMNIINALESKFEKNDDNVLVTHDVVRPFVTLRIIEENIKTALKYGACDTVVRSHDTVVESNKEKTEILNVPNREFVFLGQTPQSFNMKKLSEFYNELTYEEKSNLTDACKIFVIKGESVKLIEGEFSNMKITTVGDYQIAQSLFARHSEKA
ncbi:MAG: 2-C-methyl-D-erythritol 4-phosphate cytidylyltransferase [Oscillospiraceae bacterium]|jgi:2-C-methyl-D-erythritol 4-phosphate cytidylyltransferase|nr:2-C-methyl-D-erythritol 4-phosphate cytidylyltransferase [Oscillospiraceae bacterium]